MPDSVSSEEYESAKHGVSAQIPDWSRERKGAREWNPGKALLASIRSYESAGGTGTLNSWLRAWSVLRHRFWSAVTGADIPLNSRIAGGLMIPHPNGIVIHPAWEIGPNCLIFQQVTIGASDRGVPRIGGHVDIGAGAKILGDVKIGDHVRIGANAVVLQDVPPYSTAVGVPAQILRRDSTNDHR